MAPNNLHTTHAQETFNWVWDDGTSEWVKMTQPGGGSGGAVTIADGADVTQGAKADVAWVSGDGTVISLLKKIASAGGSAVSIANGADVAEGTTTDAAVTTDTSGTVIGFLRGLVTMVSSVWALAGAATLKAFSVQGLPGGVAVATSDQYLGVLSTLPGDTAPVALGVQGITGGLPVEVNLNDVLLTGSMTNPGDFLEISTVGMSTLSGNATTNDTASTYQFTGSTDGTNFFYGLQPVFNDTASGWITSPSSATLSMSTFATAGVTPQFSISTQGMVKIRMIRTGGSTAQTWALVASPANFGPTSMTLRGATGTAASVDSNGGLRVDATNGDLTVQGKVTDPSNATLGRVPAAGLFNDAMTTLSANTNGALRITGLRGLHVNLRDNTGAEIAPLTDTQLRATALSTLPVLNTSTGTASFTANGQTAIFSVGDAASMTVSVENGGAMGAFNSLQVTGRNNVSGSFYSLNLGSLGSGYTEYIATNPGTTGLYIIPTAGLESIRFTANALVWAGTTTIYVKAVAAGDNVARISSPLVVDISGGAGTIAQGRGAIFDTFPWWVRLTDGSRDSTVKAASTAAVAADTALVVAVSPNNSVAVTGTVTATISPIDASGQSTTDAYNQYRLQEKMLLAVLVSQTQDILSNDRAPNRGFELR